MTIMCTAACAGIRNQFYTVCPEFVVRCVYELPPTASRFIIEMSIELLYWIALLLKEQGDMALGHKWRL